MKTVSTVLTATVLVGVLSLPTLAYDEGHSTTKAKEGASEPGSKIPEHVFKGEHTMKGTISKLDQSKGLLDLKTEEGATLSLHFPPSALTNLKEGDRVAVEMGITPLATATAKK
ncbi:MAG TPA: hypothetical protein VGX03_24955 [Candidatus Binatia bacterium]|jgi:hypothetical protein|nr:hypothetical protein [Candidatus Binatia bacterium]